MYVSTQESDFLFWLTPEWVPAPGPPVTEGIRGVDRRPAEEAGPEKRGVADVWDWVCVGGCQKWHNQDYKEYIKTY